MYVSVLYSVLYVFNIQYSYSLYLSEDERDTSLGKETNSYFLAHELQIQCYSVSGSVSVSVSLQGHRYRWVPIADTRYIMGMRLVSLGER